MAVAVARSVLAELQCLAVIDVTSDVGRILQSVAGTRPLIFPRGVINFSTPHVINIGLPALYGGLSVIILSLI